MIINGFSVKLFQTGHSHWLRWVGCGVASSDTVNSNYFHSSNCDWLQETRDNAPKNENWVIIISVISMSSASIWWMVYCDRTRIDDLMAYGGDRKHVFRKHVFRHPSMTRNRWLQVHRKPWKTRNCNCGVPCLKPEKMYKKLNHVILMMSSHTVYQCIETVTLEWSALYSETSISSGTSTSTLSTKNTYF
jgi:hypothetical protein